jgi:hypothetical protein
MKKVVKLLFGAILALGGIYLAFLEIGMAVSETQLLSDIGNLVTFLAFLCIAIALIAVGGLMVLRNR